MGSSTNWFSKSQVKSNLNHRLGYKNQIHQLTQHKTVIAHVLIISSRKKEVLILFQKKSMDFGHVYIIASLFSLSFVLGSLRLC